jgi:hypothetical protein
MWRAALGPLVWLAALGLLASAPLSAFIASTGFDLRDRASYTPLAVLGLALATILGLPLTIGSAAGSLIVLEELARTGAVKTTALAAFCGAYRLFGRILIAWLAMGATLAVLAAPAGVAWLWLGDEAPATLALGAIGGIAISILWVRWAPATAIVVLEGRPPLEAILRAMALTRGRFFRVLAVLGAFAIVSYGAKSIAALLGGSPEVAQILALLLEIVLLAPLSAAIGYALYLGLLRARPPRT